MRSKINESWSAAHSKPSFMPFRIPSRKLPNLKLHVGNCFASLLNVAGFPMPFVSTNVTRASCGLAAAAVAIVMTCACKSIVLCMSVNLAFSSKAVAACDRSASLVNNCTCATNCCKRSSITGNGA